MFLENVAFSKEFEEAGPEIIHRAFGPTSFRRGAAQLSFQPIRNTTYILESARGGSSRRAYHDF